MAMIARIDKPAKGGDNVKLEFEHVAGAMKFSFKGFPKEAHYVRVTAYGKKLYGEFPAMDDNYFSSGVKGDWVISTEDHGDKNTVDEGNMQPIWTAEGPSDRTVYVPMPVGEYPEIKVEILEWYEGRVIWSRTTTRANTIGRGQIVVMPEVEIPGLALSGVFNDWDAKGLAFSDVEGKEGWQAVKGVELKAGEGFKITKYGSWLYSIGATGTDEGKDYLTISARQECNVSMQDGAPNFAMDADGSYDIYYHDGVQTLVVYPAGAAFESEAIEGWNIWANFESGDTWKVVEMQDAAVKVNSAEKGGYAQDGFRVAKNVKVEKDAAPFIINLNGKFESKYGFKQSRSVSLNSSMRLTSSGEDMYIEKAGEYDFYCSGSYLLVTPSGVAPVINEIGVLGSFNGYGTSVPLFVDESDPEDYCFAACGLELGDNVEFYFDMVASSNAYFGPSEDSRHEVGDLYNHPNYQLDIVYFDDYFYNAQTVIPYRFATQAGKKYDIILLQGLAGVMVLESEQPRPKRAEGWNLIGIGNRWGYYDDILMEDKVVNGRTWRFAGNVSCKADDEFLFRKDGGYWNDIAGWQELQDDGKGYPVTAGEYTIFNGRSNVRIPQAGSYDFYFDPDGRIGIVAPAGTAIPAEVPQLKVYVLDESENLGQIAVDQYGSYLLESSLNESVKTTRIGSYTYKTFSLPVLKGEGNLDIEFRHYYDPSYSPFPDITGVSTAQDIYLRLSDDIVMPISDPANPEPLPDRPTVSILVEGNANFMLGASGYVFILPGYNQIAMWDEWGGEYYSVSDGVMTSFGDYDYCRFEFHRSNTGAETDLLLSCGPVNAYAHIQELKGDYYFRINDRGECLQITDPANPEDFPPVDHSTEAWILAGTFNEWDTYDTTHQMTYKDDEFVFEGISLVVDDRFKFVRDGGWAGSNGIWRGYADGVTVTVGNDFAIEQPGEDIIITEAGIYDIHMSADATTARLVKVGE